MPHIRPYQAEDRAAVARVFYRAVREGAAAHYSDAERATWAPTPDPDRARPDKLLSQWCLVAEEGGRVTGFFSMDRFGYLDMAFVLPEVMGDGTAAALYDALLARARSHGLTRFTVRASEQSRRFLLRRGWVVQGFERVAKDGVVFHINLMSLGDSARATIAQTRLIRAYTADDRAALAHVRFRAIREGAASEYSQSEREAWAPSPEPDWTEADRFVDQFCYLAQSGSKITGFMAMDRTGFLDSAYVLPEVMGDGTAALLYDRLTLAAREAGVTCFTVHAVEASRRFLARRGWHFDGRQEFHEDGHSYSVNLMSLDLGTVP